MSIQANPYPLRIDKTVMEKFKIIAKENGRSINKEIEMLLKEVITEYENKKGIISLPIE